MTAVRRATARRHIGDGPRRDARAHCRHAAGARILMEPTDFDYGERQYEAEDLAGHRWTFSETLADVAPEDWGGEAVLAAPWPRRRPRRPRRDRVDRAGAGYRHWIHAERTPAAARRRPNADLSSSRIAIAATCSSARSAPRRPRQHGRGVGAIAPRRRREGIRWPAPGGWPLSDARSYAAELSTAAWSASAACSSAP